MKTYTVKAGDFLLGIRQNRKAAVNLLFAASVGAGDTIVGRKDFEKVLVEYGSITNELTSGRTSFGSPWKGAACDRMRSRLGTFSRGLPPSSASTQVSVADLSWSQS